MVVDKQMETAVCFIGQPSRICLNTACSIDSIYVLHMVKAVQVQQLPNGFAIIRLI